ncbi:MAG: hypothetical protein H6721_20370 [Sandaracinus sp.]|nr:hypothetical protein [Sandaracinus sp.]MCB9615500.1 hypothetical protein [Sandaracinus sp.]MCB9617912.1 hypothetical protein [Sandaracinus sp.]MCB9623695.1 hypothetical protein [Sandaracinus sp.]MCB9634485.1 hypothetical protein [Sandaracinus sp.]
MVVIGLAMEVAWVGEVRSTISTSGSASAPDVTGVTIATGGGVSTAVDSTVGSAGASMVGPAGSIARSADARGAEFAKVGAASSLRKLRTASAAATFTNRNAPPATHQTLRRERGGGGGAADEGRAEKLIRPEEGVATLP